MAADAAPRSFTPLIGLPAIVVDTETTGLDTRSDRIVQLAAVRMAGTEVLAGTIDTCIDPGVPIPPAAAAIHGLTDADVASAQSFADIAGAFLAFAGDRIVVGHNIGFDMALMRAEAERHNLDWPTFRALDLGIVARALNPALPDHGLDAIAAWLDVPVVGRHSALGDVRITTAIWSTLIDRLGARDIRTLGEVERLAGSRIDQIDDQVAAGWQTASVPERADASMATLAPLDPYPFRHRLRDVMSAPPVVVDAALPLRAAIAQMAREGISSLLVGTADDDKIVGIVTERDVLRLIADASCDIDTLCVKDAMSAPVEGVGADEPLYRALGRMSRLGLRHLAVWGEDGRAAGVVSARDLLRHRLTETFVLGDHIRAAPDSRGLAEAYGRLPAAAERLLVEQMPARDIAQVISAEIRAITERAAGLALAQMAADGRGAPPCRWCLLVLGSAGRGESLLAPDQDNALIYDGSNADDDWFAAFSTHIADLLDAAGIVYCKGGVMAKTPDWRQTPGGWRARIGQWLSRARPEDLLNVDIFFDMYAVAGDARLADALHRDALDRASRSPAFLNLLAARIAGLRAPLGYFGGWQRRNGRVDLKLGALMPITATARLLALRHARRERTTPDRLDGAAADGHLSPGDARLLTRLHGELMALILRQQIADLRAGRKPSSRVEVKAWLDRDHDRTLRRRLGELENVLSAARGIAAA